MNHVVFDNVTFFVLRLKSSFVSMVTSWVEYIEVKEDSLDSLGFCAFGW